MRIRSLTVFTMWLTCATTSVQASPAEIFEFDAKSSALGGAMVASSDDYTAAFYNPGALTRTRHVSTGLGISAALPTLKFEQVSGQFKAVEPASRYSLYTGLSAPLGHPQHSPFALGLAITVPTAFSLRGEISSSEHPQFYRYQNRPDRVVSAASLAYRILPYLSLGIGARLLADLTGRVELGIRLSQRQLVDHRARVEFPLKLTPTAGILIGPFNGFHIGMGWRAETGLRFSIPNRLVIDDEIELDFALSGIVLYSPERFTVGAEYLHDPSRTALTLELSYVRWSRAPDPSLQVAVDASGALLESLGLDQRLDVQGRTLTDLGFQDIIETKVGLEHELSKRWQIRGGYAHRPAPLPAPTKLLNYVDPTSNRLSVGAGLTLRDGTSQGAGKLSVDFAYAITLISRLRVRKAAGQDDPVGDYTASGSMHQISFGFRHQF